jgi:hypothetical protein
MYNIITYTLTLFGSKVMGTWSWDPPVPEVCKKILIDFFIFFFSLFSVEEEGRHMQRLPIALSLLSLDSLESYGGGARGEQQGMSPLIP